MDLIYMQWLNKGWCGALMIKNVYVLRLMAFTLNMQLFF